MEKLQKISFVVSLIGILLLFALSGLLAPPLTDIADISEKNLGERLALQGNFTSIKNFDDDNFQIIHMKDKTGNITIVSNSKSPIIINKSVTYIVTGEVQLYKGELQINADEIGVAGQ